MPAEAGPPAELAGALCRAINEVCLLVCVCVFSPTFSPQIDHLYTVHFTLSYLYE